MTGRIPALTSVNTQLSLSIPSEEERRRAAAPSSGICNQLQSACGSVLISASVANYISASLAARTRLAYQGDLADFLAWGGEVPCSAETLANYIAERAKIHSPFTIGRRIVGISRAHTAQGLPDPAKNDLVRAVMRGVRRTSGRPQRQVAPILKSDLLSILPLMVGIKGCRDKALILLGFAAALRRSELVALDVEDVQFVKEGIVLQIQRSKTDQNGEGRKIAIPYGRTSACPIKAIQEWLSQSRIDKGALFRTMTKRGAIGDGRLSPQSVALLLKSYAAAVGLDPAHYSGHSLRAGLITSAAMAGVSIWKIKAQSGHKSDAMVSRYIRDANLFDANAAGAVL